MLWVVSRGRLVDGQILDLSVMFICDCCLTDCDGAEVGQVDLASGRSGTRAGDKVFSSQGRWVNISALISHVGCW
jgi:hypothetical protein